MLSACVNMNFPLEFNICVVKELPYVFYFSSFIFHERLLRALYFRFRVFELRFSFKRLKVERTDAEGKAEATEKVTRFF